MLLIMLITIMLIIKLLLIILLIIIIILIMLLILLLINKLWCPSRSWSTSAIMGIQSDVVSTGNQISTQFRYGGIGLDDLQQILQIRKKNNAKPIHAICCVVISIPSARLLQQQLLPRRFPPPRRPMLPLPPQPVVPPLPPLPPPPPPTHFPHPPPPPPTTVPIPPRPMMLPPPLPTTAPHRL